VSSLNPALEDARYCPRCGNDAQVDFPRSIRCAHCGYGAFYNPKPVACAIPATQDGDVILMRRAFPPHEGRWSMPGGFVDLGESVEDAVRREAREELNLDIEVQRLIGVYSHAADRHVVVVYAARARNHPSISEEALEVAAFAPNTIPWQELAFESDERALRDYFSAVPR
jgi:ADP-ribose pyrophosphatase YjhB (NUDIX family)